MVIRRDSNQKILLESEDKEQRTLKYYLLGIILTVLIFLSVYVDNFFSYNNILNIISQVAPIGVMACGLSYVIITGGIDISLPSVMAMASVFGVSTMVSTNNSVLGGIIILLVGIGIGAFNGFAVAYLGMVPMVVTLATMTIATGVTTAYTGGLSIIGVPQAYMNFFNRFTNIFLFIFVAIVFTAIVKRTVFGRLMYCIGQNENTVKASGINSRLVKFFAYIVAGFSASIAGLINIASIAGARDTMGPNTQIIEIVTAAVIGGVAIQGGKGDPSGAAFGAFLVIMINTIINFIGISDYYTGLIKGLIMILAILINSIRNSKTT